MTDNKIEIGKLGKAAGLHGAIVFHYAGDTPDNLKTYKTLHLEGERELTIKTVKIAPKKITLTFDIIQTRTDAEALTGLKVYITRAQLPKNTDADSIYIADLMDMSVIDETGQSIGTCTGANNFGAQDILEITLHNGKKKHLPFTKQAVTRINQDEKIIEILTQLLC